MTAYEILNRGFSLCGENFRGFGEKETALVWLNEAIGECLCRENMIREKTGKAPAENIEANSLTDTVDNDYKIAAYCLPLAVAAMVYRDREDNYMSSVYRNRFLSRLTDVAGSIEKPITDYYGGRP